MKQITTKPVLIKDLGSQYPTKTSTYKKRIGLFRCECGKEFKTVISSVNSGNTKSCGCLNDFKRKTSQQTHGMSDTRLFKIWAGIIKRCTNKKCIHYKNYGGRGIVVCDEWMDDSSSFIRWALLNGYSDDLTIDRIDNDNGYSPDNCRWTDRRTQNINKRKQNSCSSKYIGVSFHSKVKKFCAYVNIDGKRKHIGVFEDEYKAAMHRDNFISTHGLDNKKNFN